MIQPKPRPRSRSSRLPAHLAVALLLGATLLGAPLTAVFVPAEAWAQGGSNPSAAHSAAHSGAPTRDEPAARASLPPRGADPAVPLTYLELGFGGSAAGSDTTPTVCLFSNPWWRLAVSACGTGSELWRSASGVELSHYLVHYRLLRWSTETFHFEPYVGAGLSELQVGPDAPGFAWSGKSQRNGELHVSTTGPATALHLRFAHALPHGFEATMSLSGGFAHFAAAPRLSAPQGAWQSFATLTAGVGF